PPPVPHPSLFPYTTLFRSTAGNVIFCVVDRHNNADQRLVFRPHRHYRRPLPSCFPSYKKKIPQNQVKNNGGGVKNCCLRRARRKDRKSTRLNSSHVSISYA